MRTLFLIVVAVCSNLLFSSVSFSQTDDIEIPSFACPLNDTKRLVDSVGIRYTGGEERKLVISSATDSLVKSCADGVVSAIQRDPDGTFEIVYNYDDFWFWISGVQQPLVRVQQRIKKGQVIGKLNPGARLEILLFDFETPTDPADYLPCFPKQEKL